MYFSYSNENQRRSQWTWSFTDYRLWRTHLQAVKKYQTILKRECSTSCCLCKPRCRLNEGEQHINLPPVIGVRSSRKKSLPEAASGNPRGPIFLLYHQPFLVCWFSPKSSVTSHQQQECTLKLCNWFNAIPTGPKLMELLKSQQNYLVVGVDGTVK